MTTTLFVAVAFILIYFVLTPILVGRKQIMSADPVFEDVPPDDPRLPEAARAFHEDVAAELAPLGFEPAAYLINTNTAPNVTGYLAIFSRYHTRDQVAALAVFARAGRLVSLWSYNVEFNCGFTDGTDLNTNNSREPLGLHPAPWTELQRIPDMTSPAELCRVHEELAMRRGLAKRPPPAPEEMAARLREDTLKQLQVNAERGWLRLDPDQRVYRHTLKSSLLVITRHLPPINMICRAQIRRRARALLRELNLPTDYVTASYKRRYRQYEAAGAPDPGPIQVEVEPEPLDAEEVSACALCGQSIRDVCYTVSGKYACQACGERALRPPAGGARVGRAAAATALGGLACLIAATIHFLFCMATGYDMGWIALLSGLLIGGAVWLASGRRGGWPYQTLAMLLTYFSVGLAYGMLTIDAIASDPNAFQDFAQVDCNMPEPAAELLLEPNTPGQPLSEPPTALTAESNPQDGAGEAWATSLPADPNAQPESQPAAGRLWPGLNEAELEPPAPGEWVLALVGLALLCPVLFATESFFAVLFVSLALYEAWRINKRRHPDVSGPHAIGVAEQPAGAADLLQQ